MGYHWPIDVLVMLLMISDICRRPLSNVYCGYQISQLRNDKAKGWLVDCHIRASQINHSFIASSLNHCEIALLLLVMLFYTMTQ